MKLTDQERMTSAHFTGCEVADEHYHREDVERIVAARLATVADCADMLARRRDLYRREATAEETGMAAAYSVAHDFLRLALATDPAARAVVVADPADTTR